MSIEIAERLLRLPQRRDETWQGGPMRLPQWVHDRPDDEPCRPWFGLWVSTRTHKIHMGKWSQERRWAPGLVIDALVSFSENRRDGGYRPGRVQVREVSLAEHLQETLAGTGIDVELVEQLDEWEDFVSSMRRHFSEDGSAFGALGASGVTLDRMRSFADAAKRFYEAAPWQHLTNDDLIRVEAPEPPSGNCFFTVLGEAGIEYGIGFFGSIEQFERSGFEGASGRITTPPDGIWSLTLCGLPEIPVADADLWDDHELPTAGDQAYPFAACFLPNGSIERPDAGRLAFFEAILTALAETTETELDTGRWTKTVTTRDGVVVVTLALPDLLDPPNLPLLDRRATERMMAEVQRFASTHDFESLNDLNEAIRKRFTESPIDQIPTTASTPLERAQDLVYQAFDSRGRRRLILARKALEISPDCADAYAVLAERAASLEQERELYEQGLAAGERAMIALRREEKGETEYWGDVRTRPYMRARLALAECLEELGEEEAAIQHYQELLQLNRNDNQGVRHRLLPLLLERQADVEAEQLLVAYAADVTALWRYARALLSFRREGDSELSRRDLRGAVEANRHMTRYLAGDAEPPLRMPDSYAIGSKSEGAIFAPMLIDAWRGTPGALEWLKTRAKAGKGRAKKKADRPRKPTGRGSGPQSKRRKKRL